MSPPQPKFSVGEDVLIKSEQYPQANGWETQVEKRMYVTDFEMSAGTYYTGWGYIVNPDPKLTGHTEGDGWLQESLRKRPGDYSFKELMTSLKRNKPLSDPRTSVPKKPETVNE